MVIANDSAIVKLNVAVKRSTRSVLCNETPIVQIPMAAVPSTIKYTDRELIAAEALIMLRYQFEQTELEDASNYTTRCSMPESNTSPSPTPLLASNNLESVSMLNDELEFSLDDSIVYSPEDHSMEIIEPQPPKKLFNSNKKKITRVRLLTHTGDGKPMALTTLAQNKPPKFLLKSCRNMICEFLNNQKLL